MTLTRPGAKVIGTATTEGERVSTKTKNGTPRRVLIGYDDSDGAKDAVRLARTLCAGTHTEALLVNVLPLPGALPVAYRLLGYDEAPAWKPFFREAEEMLDGMTVHHRTYVGGSPAEVLNDLAEEEGIDLVVVGSPHRGVVGRTFIGSVAEGLLHGASVAVMAAPRGYSERVHHSFARIVVAYDGSTEADAALRRGEAIAARKDCELHVISVTTPPTAAPGPFAGVVPSTLPNADEIVVRGVGSVSDDVDVRGEAFKGAVMPELARYVGPDDLLLVGSRSYGPVARTLLGSVSSALIRVAPCPVLVVPRPLHVIEPGVERRPALAEAA
jgi:nucleotide-binding universal stress UspA family protein